MAKGVVYVIEHLEETISGWLLLEYSHASKIVGYGNLVITNVKREEDKRKLSSVGVRILEKRVFEVFGEEELIILDPKASTSLTTSDCREKKYMVIGGIMGDHPPRGRTWSLLSSRVPRALKRNLGKNQLSIDSAVYVAREICNGKKLEDIRFVKNPVIKARYMSLEYDIELPYAYPVVNGKPLITPGLEDYLRHKIIIEEQEILDKNFS